MKKAAWRERLLFALFFIMAAVMIATGFKLDHIPETLFNATLV